MFTKQNFEFFYLIGSLLAFANTWDQTHNLTQSVINSMLSWFYLIYVVYTGGTFVF